MSHPEVFVCDAIMGSGKSQSAISYMNEHKDQKFVYITPYLEEAKRIMNGCPELDFVAPSNNLSDSNFSKIEHTRELLKSGRNITTTHAAFRSYTEDMIDAIKEYGYTLLADEAIEVFREVEYSSGDVKLFLDGGYISFKDDSYVKVDKPYEGDRLRDLFDMIQCNNLLQVEKGKRGVQYYYWALPSEILLSFKQVFIMTYLFESTELKYFFDINKIEYQYIGIERDGDTYRFAMGGHYVPDYVKTLKSKVHIFGNEKLNQIGDRRTALSANWLCTHEKECAALKNNVYNYFHNYLNAKSNEVLWSTFKGSVKNLRGKGFAKQHIAFNMRAKNDWRSRTKLAYLVNIFASPQKVRFFQNYGIQYDEDGYALSVMIQWIWRSAIRDGKEISLYIPSRRMRNLLIQWMDNCQQGGQAD